MEKISVAEFFKRLTSFRKNVTFNSDVVNEERRDALQKIKYSYLIVDQTDPKISDLVTTLFDVTVLEFELWTGLMSIKGETL